MIYLDNGATSNPKPNTVAEAMVKYITNFSANPGRAGHNLANSAAREIYKTREIITKLFHTDRSDHVIFTKNITESLNLSLKGILKPCDHIIVSSMEHNSMMRPIRTLIKLGIEVTVINANPKGEVSAQQFRNAIRPNSKMIALNHISNVTGTIQPAKEIGEIARENSLLFLLDTAQSAGYIDINMEDFNIDILAFTGHKSLLGPMGIGGLIIGDRVNLNRFTPLIEGGTGSLSEDETQPTFMPDFLESGTPNLPAIAGLRASVSWILDRGIETINREERRLTNIFINGLKEISNVNIIGDIENRGSVISITINNRDIGEVGLILDREYDIACRVGLHCSPTSHKTVGTFPNGTIRFSLGVFTTESHITKTLSALNSIINPKE